MEKTSIVTRLFEILDQSAAILEKEEKVTYLEALCLTADNIVDDTVHQENLEGQLKPLYGDFFSEGLTAEDVRRSFQLAVLKGMKAVSQSQHQMTPDSVALFMGYLINKLPLPDTFTLLDPGVGTGNLLTAALNASQRGVRAFGVEIDELLLKLAYSNANLQQQEVELFHQDAFRPLLVDPVDLIVSDPPVGYYTDEPNARNFQVGKTEERPYSHFLMIEQGLNYTKEAGFNLHLVPNDLFSSDKDGVLHQLIKDQAVILGMLQLPETMFKDSNQAKSILLLQKKGTGVEAPDQVLLAQLPSFKNPQAMMDMMTQIESWFAKHFQASRGNK